MDLIGLDGCKNGAWIATRPGGRFEIIHDLRPLLERVGRHELRLVLDVPIGLDSDGRRCDREARTRIGPRRNSVFNAPCREALVATSQKQASQISLGVCGKGIGAQGFGILSRIAVVDQLITPALQTHVHEGHPELSFAVAANCHLRFNKKCRQGEAERMEILAASGLRFDPAAVRQQLGRGWMERDDVIDAAVMLLTAVRVECGEAVRLPSGIEDRDGRGLLMEMWA